jgi:hypothetical protein
MGTITALEMDVCCNENPHEGETCIKINYALDREWSAIAWQCPANNWGTDPYGGYNLTGAQKLTLWARADRDNVTAEFKFGLEGFETYRDTASVSCGEVKLMKTWQKFTIPILTSYNMERIINGFVCVMKGTESPMTLYLDDIQYE